MMKKTRGMNNTEDAKSKRNLPPLKNPKPGRKKKPNWNDSVILPSPFYQDL